MSISQLKLIHFFPCNKFYYLGTVCKRSVPEKSVHNGIIKTLDVSYCCKMVSWKYWM